MSEDSINGEPFTILLVEDNPSHAEIVIRSLAKHNVANKIIHIQDGVSALDYLYNRGAYIDPVAHRKPHVVLLDLRLPKMDGLEVLKQIKAEDSLKDIPVVVLSSSHSEEDIAKSYECRANSYLVKPIDFEKFQTMMKDIGFYWLGWNRLPYNGDVVER